jgi:alkylation response protein AidB-like acyl-CoA dehydrogenase
MVRRFVASRYDLQRRRSWIESARGYSEENWRALSELGLFSFLLPEAAGGLGGGLVDSIIVAEELGHGLALEPVIDEVVLCAGLIARCGTEVQVRHWLPGVTGGDRHIVFAHAEPGGRYRIEGRDCVARREGHAYCLNGTKTFVRGAATASAFLVTAAGTDGDFGLFLVEASTGGISRTDYRIADGSRASELRFDNVAVPASCRLPAASEDATLAVARTKLAFAAETLGIMTLLYDRTLDYVKTRHQFGVAIGSFQAVQHRMARLYILIEQSRSLLLKAALGDARGRSWLRSVAAAKAYIAECSIALAHECVQFHGGMGITDELIIGHGLRRLMVLARQFGDASKARSDYAQLSA